MAGENRGRRKGGRKKLTGRQKHDILVKIEEIEDATHSLEESHHRLHGQLKKIRKTLGWMDFFSWDPN